MSGLFLYGILRMLGVRVTSFYRTPEHNAELPGAVPNSGHLFFRAIDAGLETPERILKLCEYMGFTVLRNDLGTHHHIQSTDRSEIFFSGTSAINNSSFFDVRSKEIKEFFPII